MTLLVLTLTLPDDLAQSTHASLSNLISGQLHKFLNYFFAFLILAIFWIMLHQQFHWIRRADIKLLLINIFILMFVALMPFSTDIAGDFSGSVTAEVFFASNVMVLGLLTVVNWAYATHHHHLVEQDLEPAIIRTEFRRGAVVPLISAVVLGLSFLAPWNLWLYLVVPIALLLRPRRREYHASPGS
jgi:uncharacterized membrane protein